MPIDHLAIWTGDLERLRAFYQDYFDAQVGVKYKNNTRGFTSYFLVFGGETRLEIMQMEGIPPTRNDPLTQFTGLIHFALSVGTPAAVDALTARLEADGYPVVSPPRRTGDGYYESAILDPDGNRVEIMA